MQISFYRKSTTLSFALIFAFPIIDDLRLLIKTKRKVDEQVAAGRQKQNKVDSFNKQQRKVTSQKYNFFHHVKISLS